MHAKNEYNRAWGLHVITKSGFNLEYILTDFCAGKNDLYRKSYTSYPFHLIILDNLIPKRVSLIKLDGLIQNIF